MLTRYTVVGSGPGGMTVATRLVEDPNITVLLLEAGPIDNDEPWVRIPFFAGQGVGSDYDWNLMTVPQSSLDGQARAIPQGRALGGGSIINAMLWNRGGIEDYNDWASLGNPGWSWPDLLPYFIKVCVMLPLLRYIIRMMWVIRYIVRHAAYAIQISLSLPKLTGNYSQRLTCYKSETFTPFPSIDIANADGIGYSPTVHGSTGPINISFSPFIYNQTRNLFAALSELGIPTSFDPSDGSLAGAAFLPATLDPAQQVRADARRSHNATIYSMPNLDIWTGQHVTRILFEGGSGNANSTDPVPGDSSMGQGNATNAYGALFGVRNTTGQLLDPNTHRKSKQRRKRSLVFQLLTKIKDWLTSQARQSPSQAQSAITAQSLRVVGVEFAANSSSQRRNLTAKREVIVSAGAIHTPQLLKLSGVGPAVELQNLLIPVMVDLPGVGTNLQDHILVGVYCERDLIPTGLHRLTTISDPYANHSYVTSTQIRGNGTLMYAAEMEYTMNRTGPWTAGPPDGNAFPSLVHIVNSSNTIIPAAQAQTGDKYLQNGSDPTVVAGYIAQRDLLVAALQDRTRAAYELLNFNYGAFSNAAMRPFSRGVVNVWSLFSL